MTTYQLAAEVGLNQASIVRPEQGASRNPDPEKLRGIAVALHLNLADVLLLADYPVSNDLPNPGPYLRTKYRDLPEPAIAELQRAVQEVLGRHGIEGLRRCNQAKTNYLSRHLMLDKRNQKGVLMEEPPTNMFQQLRAVVLKTEQTRITQGLETAERLLAASLTEFGLVEERLTEALELAQDCQAAYRAADPKIRRQINQVFFERLEVDDGGEVRGDLAAPFNFAFIPVTA